MSRAVILLAEGFEEMEAVVPIDILRRGGAEVTTAGIGARRIVGAHGLPVEADTRLTRIEDFLDFDALILPGGMPGSKNLADSWEVNELVVRMFNAGKLIGAICAAPAVVLASCGVLEGRKAVCYPGAESYAPEIPFGDKPVERDGNLITARGPGYAAPFALELLTVLESEETARKVAKAALFIV